MFFLLCRNAPASCPTHSHEVFGAFVAHLKKGVGRYPGCGVILPDNEAHVECASTPGYPIPLKYMDQCVGKQRTYFSLGMASKEPESALPSSNQERKRPARPLGSDWVSLFFWLVDNRLRNCLVCIISRVNSCYIEIHGCRYGQTLMHIR